MNYQRLSKAYWNPRKSYVATVLETKLHIFTLDLNTGSIHDTAKHMAPLTGFYKFSNKTRQKRFSAN